MMLGLAVMVLQQAPPVAGSSFRVAGRSGSCDEFSVMSDIGYGC